MVDIKRIAVCNSCLKSSKSVALTTSKLFLISQKLPVCLLIKVSRRERKKKSHVFSNTSTVKIWTMCQSLSCQNATMTKDGPSELFHVTALFCTLLQIFWIQEYNFTSGKQGTLNKTCWKKQLFEWVTNTVKVCSSGAPTIQEICSKLTSHDQSCVRTWFFLFWIQSLTSFLLLVWKEWGHQDTTLMTSCMFFPQ